MSLFGFDFDGIIAMGTSGSFLECGRVIIQVMQSGACIFAQIPKDSS